MATGRRATRPKVERKIYFYRVVARDPDKKVTFSKLKSAMQKVANLKYNAVGRYWNDSKGNSLCVWPDLPEEKRSSKVKQLRMKIGIVRRTELPDVEKGGKLSALRIAREAGLSEMIHVIIFKEDMIAGVEFNFYGPRIGRLEDYLKEKKAKIGLVPLSFEAILQRNAEAALDKFGDINLLSLRLMRTDAALLARADKKGLGGVFAATLEKLDAPVVEIVLRGKARSPKPLKRKFFNFVKVLAKEPKMRETLETFKVRGHKIDSDRVEELDILKDAFISSKRVIRRGDRRRSLDSRSMYKAIEESYRELAPELRDAIAVGAEN